VHDRTKAQLANQTAVRDDLAIGSGTPVIVECAGDAVRICRARGVTETLGTLAELPATDELLAARREERERAVGKVQRLSR